MCDQVLALATIECPCTFHGKMCHITMYVSLLAYKLGMAQSKSTKTLQASTTQATCYKQLRKPE